MPEQTARYGALENPPGAEPRWDRLRTNTLQCNSDSLLSADPVAARRTWAPKSWPSGQAWVSRARRACRTNTVDRGTLAPPWADPRNRPRLGATSRPPEGFVTASSLGAVLRGAVRPFLES